MFRHSGNADRGFSEDCLPVQATFTGDDKIRIFYVIRKPGFPENDLDAGFETAVEKGPKGKTKSSGGSGSGKSRICFRIFLPGQSGIPEKPLVHFMDHGFVSSFLGTENGTAALLTAEGVGDITGNEEGTVF